MPELFPKAGEWPCYRRDGTLQARSPLKGQIGEPKIAWKHYLGEIETLAVVEPAGANTTIDMPSQARTQEWSEIDNPRWGVIPAVGLVEGRLQPVKNTKATTYASIFPDTPGLQKIEFESGFRKASYAVKGEWPSCVGHCFTWTNGQWTQVWESEPITGLFHPEPLVGDFDGDGNLEVAVLPWYELVILDARTGRIKDRVRFTTDLNGRNYGWFGAYDLNGDGLTEFIIQADFPKHVDVLGYRDGKVGLLWRRELEASITDQRKLLQVNPNPVVDVDGDGQLEVLVSTLNDAGDWRWRLSVHDGMTGEIKAELLDECLQGVVDLDGDGVSELLTMKAPEACLPPYGTITVRSLKGGRDSTLWSCERAAWQLWEHALPLHVTDVVHSDRRDVLCRVVDGRPMVVFRQPVEGDPAQVVLSTASWAEGRLEVGTTVKGTELEGLGLDSTGALLVRARTIPGQDASLAVSSGRGLVLGSYPKGAAHGQPAVVWDKAASRPTVLYRSAGDRLIAIHPPHQDEPAIERWRRPGWGETKGSRFALWLGPVAADLYGDGRRQLLYAATAPSGCARLVAADLNGAELWHHDFPRIRGVRLLEDSDGMSDLILWQVGHFTSPDHQDVAATIRRSIHGTEETHLLSGLDGSLIWQRDQMAMTNRRDKMTPAKWVTGVGGIPFTIADYDGDGLDELNGMYAFVFYILEGDTGETRVMVNGGGPQLDGGPAQPFIYGAAVAGDFEHRGQPELLQPRGLVRPEGVMAWMDDSYQVRYEEYPACGDFDGDGRLEALLLGMQGGIRCIDPTTGILKWLLPTPWCGQTSDEFDMTPRWQTACADIDSDGRDEALLLFERTLYCVGADSSGRQGLVKWKIELPAQVGAPTIADLDGNGQASILLAGGDGYLYCVQ